MRLILLYLVPSLLLQFGLFAYAVLNGYSHVSLVVSVTGALFSLLYALLLFVTIEPRPPYVPPKYILVFAVFYFGIAVAACHYAIYFGIEGDFFAPQRPDTLFYYQWASEYSQLPLAGFISVFLESEPLSDLGTVLFVRAVYALVPHPLAVGFVNVLLGTISAVVLFKTIGHFVSTRYAAFFAMAFAASPMVLTFNASNFKEPLLLLLVTLSFYFVARFVHRWRLRDLIFLGVPLFLLLFIRPVISAMVVLSLLLYALLERRVTLPARMVILGLSAVLFFQLIPYIREAAHRFSLFDVDRLMMTSEAVDEAGGNIVVAFAASVASTIIGPVPRVLFTPDNQVAAFNAPGLLFRYFTAFLFVLGCIDIVRKRQSELYPILFFVIMHAASLALILRGFDVRFALPHMGLVYLITARFLWRNPRFFDAHTSVYFGFLYVMGAFCLALFYNLRAA